MRTVSPAPCTGTRSERAFLGPGADAKKHSPRGRRAAPSVRRLLDGPGQSTRELQADGAAAIADHHFGEEVVEFVDVARRQLVAAVDSPATITANGAGIRLEEAAVAAESHDGWFKTT